MIEMMSASFGRELVESHFQQLMEQAEHDRLVGCLKRQRRERRGREAAARRAAVAPCPQDVG
jgi:hypothetical protein